MSLGTTQPSLLCVFPNYQVEGVGNETQPVIILHPEHRVVLPGMITVRAFRYSNVQDGIVQTQPDENNDQQMNTTIDPYGGQISGMMMPFPSGELDSQLLLKGSPHVETTTTRERFSNTLVGCITQMIRII